MKRTQRLILAAGLFTILFILLILAGSMAWSADWRRLAILCYLLSLAAIGGQLFAIILVGRQSKATKTER